MIESALLFNIHSIPNDHKVLIRNERVHLDGPRVGEVMVEIKATGVCLTDEFTRPIVVLY